MFNQKMRGLILNRIACILRQYFPSPPCEERPSDKNFGEARRRLVCRGTEANKRQSVTVTAKWTGARFAASRLKDAFPHALAIVGSRIVERDLDGGLGRIHKDRTFRPQTMLTIEPQLTAPSKCLGGRAERVRSCYSCLSCGVAVGSALPNSSAKARA